MVELSSSSGVYTIQIFQICNRTKQQHTVVGGSVHIYLVESATRNQAIAVERRMFIFPVLDPSIGKDIGNKSFLDTLFILFTDGYAYYCLICLLFSYIIYLMVIVSLSLKLIALHNLHFGPSKFGSSKYTPCFQSANKFLFG